MCGFNIQSKNRRKLDITSVGVVLRVVHFLLLSGATDFPETIDFKKVKVTREMRDALSETYTQAKRKGIVVSGISLEKQELGRYKAVCHPRRPPRKPK